MPSSLSILQSLQELFSGQDWAGEGIGNTKQVLIAGYQKTGHSCDGKLQEWYIEDIAAVRGCRRRIRDHRAEENRS